MLSSFNSAQSLSHVQLCNIMDCSTPGSTPISNSQSLHKLMSIESVMTSNHLILCHPLLLLPSILPCIRVFSNESVLCTRWSKCWSFSFSISPSNEHPGLIFFRMDWLAVILEPPKIMPVTVSTVFIYCFLYLSSDIRIRQRPTNCTASTIARSHLCSAI